MFYVAVQNNKMLSFVEQYKYNITQWKLLQMLKSKVYILI